MSTVFANGLRDLGSIPGRVIPKTQKMVLDAALLSTQHYKVGVKGKVEQSREWSSTLSYKGAIGPPSSKVANFTFTFIRYIHKLESIQENVMHKVLRVFEIQRNYQILGRITDVGIMNKKRTCHLEDFAVLADENERKQKDRQILGSCQRAKKNNCGT